MQTKRALAASLSQKLLPISLRRTRLPASAFLQSSYKRPSTTVSRQHTSAMASRRFLTIGLTAAAAGGGYYLYTAGGDPKVAQKEIKHDAARLSNKIQSELPGSSKEVKTGAEAQAQRISSSLDSAYDQAKSKGKEIESSLKGYEKDAEKKLAEAREKAGTSLKGAVNSFDKNVEEGAAKAKSGISSWFGGK